VRSFITLPILLKKQKAHHQLWRWALFPKNDYESGNSFSGQRQAGRFATTNAHALAHQFHIKKVICRDGTVSSISGKSEELSWLSSSRTACGQ
jgi:hypothetical protein